MVALTAAADEEAADAAGRWVVPPDVDVRVVAAGEGVAGEGAAWAAGAGTAALITRATAAAVIVLDRLCTGASSGDIVVSRDRHILICQAFAPSSGNRCPSGQND
jgi:hypothetical protein